VVGSGDDESLQRADHRAHGALPADTGRSFNPVAFKRTSVVHTKYTIGASGALGGRLTRIHRSWGDTRADGIGPAAPSHRHHEQKKAWRWHPASGREAARRE